MNMTCGVKLMANKDYKCGYVAIIGRPNVGKSTLLNKILGQKIVIATDKAQTTRRRIKGIHTTSEGQIIFIDTPGVHKPINNFGQTLVDEAKFAIPDSDLILFLVDASTSAGRGDKWVVSNLLNTKTPIILVYNKVDLIKDQLKREENIISYKLLFDKNLPTAKISAKTGRNLDTLLSEIYSALPAGEKIYEDDEVTDETMRDVAVEIVREKILENTNDEVPHCVYTEIEKYEELENIDRIYMTIYVEQDSQKGIIIGKKASMLKKIGSEARLELEKIVDKKVFLDLQVKVKKDWRKKATAKKN